MVIKLMEYLLFMFMPLVFIASWLLDADCLEALADFFFGGILGFSVAWLVSRERR